MPLKLHLHNPADHWRKGYVKTPWQPIYERTGIPPELAAVFDAAGNQLDTQVHRVDPEDPSRDALVFWLDKEISPGYGDPSTISASATVGERERETPRPKMMCETEGPEGDEYRVKLSNGRLSLQFELTPAPWGDSRNWYAGSTTTVLLEQESPGHLWTQDMLDAFNWFDEHDLEKRCMQVDRIRLSLPAWAPECDAEFSLIRRPYKLLSCSEGPVRASISVASSPFEYEYRDPLRGEDRTVSCRLHRVISLYRGANFVVDELSVRGAHDGGRESKPVNFFFNARYFMVMDFGRDANPSTYFRIWDWFGISSDWEPHPAFGFATDAHCSPVTPCPAYPHNKDKAFSWELERADRASCVHLFSRCDAKAIEERAGAAWFEHVYRPLWAEIAVEPPSQSPASRRGQ
jgi:hypothetical protein